MISINSTLSQLLYWNYSNWTGNFNTNSMNVLKEGPMCELTPSSILSSIFGLISNLKCNSEKKIIWNLFSQIGYYRVITTLQLIDLLRHDSTELDDSTGFSAHPKSAIKASVVYSDPLWKSRVIFVYNNNNNVVNHLKNALIIQTILKFWELFCIFYKSFITKKV